MEQDDRPQPSQWKAMRERTEQARKRAAEQAALADERPSASKKARGGGGGGGGDAAALGAAADGKESKNDAAAAAAAAEASDHEDERESERAQRYWADLRTRAEATADAYALPASSGNPTAAELAAVDEGRRAARVLEMVEDAIDGYLLLARRARRAIEQKRLQSAPSSSSSASSSQGGSSSSGSGSSSSSSSSSAAGGSGGGGGRGKDKIKTEAGSATGASEELLQRRPVFCGEALVWLFALMLHGDPQWAPQQAAAQAQAALARRAYEACGMISRCVLHADDVFDCGRVRALVVASLMQVAGAQTPLEERHFYALHVLSTLLADSTTGERVQPPSLTQFLGHEQHRVGLEMLLFFLHTMHDQSHQALLTTPAAAAPSAAAGGGGAGRAPRSKAKSRSRSSAHKSTGPHSSRSSSKTAAAAAAAAPAGASMGPFLARHLVFAAHDEQAIFQVGELLRAVRALGVEHFEPTVHQQLLGAAVCVFRGGEGYSALSQLDGRDMTAGLCDMVEQALREGRAALDALLSPSPAASAPSPAASAPSSRSSSSSSSSAPGVVPLPLALAASSNGSSKA